MEVVRRVHSMKEICRQARTNGRSVGFVPTMGALHEGHLSLVRRVREQAEVVVVSIFVNPTQFGPNEDFDAYPRDLSRDADLCIAEEVDYVFAPSVEELYPPDSQTFVEVTDLSRVLEGVSRRGHFRGVTTVVMKLFEIIKPNFAAFGRKDAQQALILRRMVRDLMMDVELLVLPIVREEDGLALSSRNRHLTPEQRQAAAAIPRALQVAETAYAEGERSPEKLVAAAREVLEGAEGIDIDYVVLADPDRLEPVDAVETEALLLVAVVVGRIRLLDNTLLKPKKKKKGKDKKAGGAKSRP